MDWVNQTRESTFKKGNEVIERDNRW